MSDSKTCLGTPLRASLIEQQQEIAISGCHHLALDKVILGSKKLFIVDQRIHS